VAPCASTLATMTAGADGAVRRWAIALIGAFAAGVAMSFGQTYAPEWLAPLCNSAAPVVAVAGLTAFAARRWWSSALIAALAGPTLIAGYYLTSQLRGFAASMSWVVLWATAGVLFGAVMGLAVWVLLHASRLMVRAVAAALWPGIALGEAAHGLLRNGESTPAGYWWAQAVVAVVVLTAVTWKHAWSVLGCVLATVSAALIAAVIFAVYGAV